TPDTASTPPADGHTANETSMLDHPVVDAWLDQWEQALKQEHQPTLDQFIGEHCRGAPPDLVEAFRSGVRALSSVNGWLLGGAGSGAAGAGDSRGASDGAAGSLDLRPGAEPVPGFRLEARLGKGGFGAVWRATAPGDLRAALKFVPLGSKGRAELRAL